MTILDRRGFIRNSLALAGSAAVFRESAAQDMPSSFQPNLMPGRDAVGAWLQKLNYDFGPQRNTGSANHVAYVNWLEEMFKTSGCATARDRYTFTRWETDQPRDVAATLTVDGATSSLDVLSYVAYSGNTTETGPRTGRLVYVANVVPGNIGAVGAVAALLQSPPADLSECIVAVECPCPSLSTLGGVPLSLYATYPEHITPQSAFKSPLWNGTFGNNSAFAALAGKCRGILFCWTDISDDAARNWVFGAQHPLSDTPALWVGAETARKLKRAASIGASASVVLRARTFPNAPTDTLIATLPGRSPEAVIIATHTDGTNAAEENGGLALLAMASYFSRVPLSARRRTLVFVAATGHMVSGPLSDKSTATGPNGQKGAAADTPGFFRDHPEIVSTLVAGIGCEHLGAMEWKDDASGLTNAATHQPVSESWFVGPRPGDSVNADACQFMAAVILKAANTENPAEARMLVERTGDAGSMVTQLLAMGLPIVTLFPLPTYLLTESPTGLIERISLPHMYAQICILTEVLTIMESLTTEQLHGREPVDVSILDTKPNGVPKP